MPDSGKDPAGDFGFVGRVKEPRPTSTVVGVEDERDAGSRLAVDKQDSRSDPIATEHATPQGIASNHTRNEYRHGSDRVCRGSRRRS